MKNDGYADHTATTDDEYSGEVWHVPSGVHGEQGYWEWSVDHTWYNLETEEEETGGVANGWAETEASATEAMNAAMAAYETEKNQ